MKGKIVIFCFYFVNDFLQKPLNFQRKMFFLTSIFNFVKLDNLNHFKVNRNPH